MTNQLPLDFNAGRLAKERGIAIAQEHGQGWMNEAIEGLRRYAREHPEFTAEMFRFHWLDAGGQAPPAHKCWGALFNWAAKGHVIAKTGRYRPAVSQKTHGHPVMLWTVHPRIVGGER